MKTFPKLINSFFVWFQKHEPKGKYRFFINTKKLFKEYLIIHSDPNMSFAVPYEQWCFWKTLGPQRYYLDETLPFCQAVNTHLADFDFIDLGADVGVVSHLVQTHCPRLNQTHAFEPNPKSFKVLQRNASNSAKPFVAYQQAISDFQGTAYFDYNKNESSDHEGHLSASRPGETKVNYLDNIFQVEEFSNHLAIKIDVEGQEQQAIRGAKKLIKHATKCVIFLELHPETLERDGATPEDLFNELESIAPCEWQVPLLNKSIDRQKPFFEQFPKRQYDVIAVL